MYWATVFETIVILLWVVTAGSWLAAGFFAVGVTATDGDREMRGFALSMAVRCCVVAVVLTTLLAFGRAEEQAVRARVAAEQAAEVKKP